MNGFHPAAIASMLKALDRSPVRPAWGEFFDGPDMFHAVRVIRSATGITIQVYSPTDFHQPYPRQPVIDEALSVALAAEFAEYAAQPRADVAQLVEAAENKRNELKAAGWTQRDFAKALTDLVTEPESAQMSMF